MVTRATPGELLNVRLRGSGLFVLRRLVDCLPGMNSSAGVGGYWRHCEFGFMVLRAVF